MRTILLLLLGLILAPSAHALIFIEPTIGYESGSLEQTIKYTNGTSTITPLDVSGVSYGAKAGLSFGRLFFGGEYTGANLQGPGGAGGIKPKDAGALAGIRLPLKIRIWGEYIFSAKSTGVEGKGYKAGASLGLLPLFDVNAEYIFRKYDKYTGTSLPAGAAYNMDVKTYRIAVGFPLRF